MAEDIADQELAEAEPVRTHPRRRRWALGMLALVLLAALLTAWLTRKQIAENVISGQIDKLGLPATYKVDSIGLEQQVITNVVIGDPAHPDLTIERVEAAVTTWWGMPAIGKVTLVRPRFHGSYRDGKLSFGSLDKLLFEGPSKGPFRIPDYDLSIVDGRGLMETDFGPVGFKAEGQGPLRGGFSGIAAAIAPDVELGGCKGRQASIYGTLKTAGEKLSFSGPLRLTGLACPGSHTQLGASGIELATTFDPAFDGAEGKLSLAAGQFAYDGQRVRQGGGDVQFTFRKRALTASYDLSFTGYEGPQARLASLTAKGALRTQDLFTRVRSDGTLVGYGLRTGSALDGALSGMQRSSAGTLGEALIGKLRGALAREQVSSRFSGEFLLRKTGVATTLTVPQAIVRGTSGQALLAVSRLQVEKTGSDAPSIDGAFATGGEGMPRLIGRFETRASQGFSAQFAMPEYAAGSARIALPDMMLVQLRGGAMGFAGSARLSGALPGGAVRQLVLPVKGLRTAAGSLAVWRECTPVRFDRLSLARLTLDRRAVTLCPPAGGAILASDARGTRIAAGAPTLAVTGRLGETPVRIASGPIGFALPGNLSARMLDLSLGPPQTASRFRITNLSAKLGANVAGRFDGADVTLNAVPLDILGAEGDWRYANGKLSLANAAFRLEDREVQDRFAPMLAHGASLQLEGNRIIADAVLQAPASRRAIGLAAIRHDLASGVGSADLTVDGITFDKRLQPDQLTPLALGIIANAIGTMRGQGRIDWNPATVTSSGRFTVDKLDFAAAFGPVGGLSGTIEFTDLLGLVTAPGQKVRIASINPGIEVDDGELTFALLPDKVLRIEGAHWPFLDGTLVLEPTQMVIGKAEARHFTLQIAGLDAAKFVQRIDMANINATGVFDGALPLMFDRDGGHIVHGYLNSRPPGGNVSYVGALTYKDMSTMANFAFDALKSMDYRQMRIDMDGPLDGEIVTHVGFEGIRQGNGARRNFVTNQIAKLPIRFNVNLRAPFFQLVTSMRSLYDPAYVRDPRALGLVSAGGAPKASDSRSVQPPVSGKAQ